MCIFLDNATSTNKNRYLIRWAIELVQQSRLDHVRLPFMVVGHTKFAPDRLFSRISNSYNSSDVFNIGEKLLQLQSSMQLQQKRMEREF